MFDSRDRKQLNPMLCLRDHKKRITWTEEFYDQSYQRRPTNQEVPGLKLTEIESQDARKQGVAKAKLACFKLSSEHLQ